MSRRKRPAKGTSKTNSTTTDRDNSIKSSNRGKSVPSSEDKSTSSDSISGESTRPGSDVSTKYDNGARTTNDPEWYSRDNQLVIDAASLPFAEPLGDPVTYAPPTDQLADWGSNKHVSSVTGKAEAFSGILTLRVKSSFGTNENIRDPLNVAANMLYTHVRYMNSGRKNYDPADLMIYVALFGDIYAYLVWMERIYAKAFVYSQRNKYIGDALLSSEGIDAADIKANLANMRYWINTYINKLASYAIPAEIYYFNRRVWMFSGLYLENPDGNIKDQLYQFTPDGFYQFGLDSNNAGCLFYKKLGQLVTPGTNGYTWAQLKQMGESLMANVLGDEDFGLMSGDIMKAFNGNIISLPSLPEVVDIIPAYSEYVLEQFHNADVNFFIDRGNSTGNGIRLGDVWQDPSTGLLKSFEGFEAYPTTWSLDSELAQVQVNTRKLLTLNSPIPNPIDNMEISRLAAKWKYTKAESAPGTKTYNVLTCGADIATGIIVTYVDNAGVIRNITHGYNIFNELSVNMTLHMYSRIVLFKYSPVCMIYHVTRNAGADGGSIDQVTYLGNVNNYTVIDSSVLDKMHQTAMLSLLSVPGVAKVVNVI